MKRLTVKADDGTYAINKRYTAGNVQEVVDRLAAYEDTGLEPEEIVDRLAKAKVTDILCAEAEKIFPLPPCEVGDTVYHFCDEFGCILPYFVETFNVGFLDKDRNYWSWEANSHAEETDELLDELDFDLDDIGKTVFLTREEAERALEGGQSDGR